MQVVDVRDLAAWIVDAAEGADDRRLRRDRRDEPMAQLLGEVAAGVDAEPSLTWVDQEFLTEQDVEPWAGAGSIPLWLPRPEYDGMMSH